MSVRIHYDALAVCRDFKPSLALGIGVVDIKDSETDCGFWMLLRSVADRKLRALVAGRDRFVGKAT